MIRYTLALLAMCFASIASAEPPPVPPGGIHYYLESACTDIETGQDGYCYMGDSIDGTTYLTFWQGSELMMIRKVLPEGYETIWMSDLFMGT